ncbi:MAG: ATP-binding cassette domain-containing protein [Patescibacteria group bacterium]|jgi:ABC-type lipoprotein export system ATPase subunit/ABC-type antimicrobial peptide transport system permease subunit
MTKPVIKISGLEKTFFVGDQYIEALKGVETDIMPGEFVVIYGPSGCGKTTLLSLMGGLDKPTAGQVWVHDQNIYTLSEAELAEYRRTKIGMVFQQFNLIPTLSAIDNIAMPLILSGVDRKKAYVRASELLSVVELSDRANHKPVELSGGQQQRIAIARALVANPWILLVDEPTGNLDEPTGLEIMRMIKTISTKWGRTVVLVTHNPDFLHYGDKILHMKDGKIVKSEATRSVLAPDNLEDDGLKYFVPKKRGSLRFLEILRISRLHFISKKMRTLLTALGVALGVGSIVTLVSLGMGLQNITSNQLASLDSLVTINVNVDKNSTKHLDQTALLELKNVQNVTLVSPSITSTARIAIDSSAQQVIAYGLEASALSFEGVYAVAGEGFDENDEIVISKAALKNFDIKEPTSALNKTVDLTFLVVPKDTNDLTSIHETTSKKKIVGVSNDELVAAIFLPIDELAKINETTIYSSLKAKVSDRKHVEAARDAIDDLGYQTTSVVDLIKKVDKIFFITEIILGIIGGVALMVALIGIINIMTISLLERTHEVGTMKAIGATNRDIKKIFEYEVLLFGLTGSIAGVVGAWIFGESINALINYLMQVSSIDGSLNIFATPMLFALEMIVVTTLVSLLAGVYPARRASKLSPMEALRYE